MATKQWYQEHKEQMRAYRKKWYDKNKGTQRQLVYARRRELTEWFRELKTTLACERCGENYFACLDFHHKDASTKEVNLSVVIVQKGWCKERILEEIAKCSILCANCHRKEHWPP